MKCCANCKNFQIHDDYAECDIVDNLEISTYLSEILYCKDYHETLEDVHNRIVELLDEIKGMIK